MTPVEVLRKAKGLIEERGWFQGSCGDVSRGCAIPPPNGPLCAGLAIDVAMGDGEDDCQPVYSLFRQGAGFRESVVNWNDHSSRTREEVLAAFDRAIALAEQEASK